MKIETTVSELLAPIKSAGRPVERKTTLPILTGLLFEANEDQTRIIGTDLHTFVTVKTDIKPVIPGSYVLPARRLQEILQALPPDGTVVLAIEIDKKTDNARATVRCGRSRFVLNIFEADQFPVPRIEPAKVVFSVPQRALLATLDSVSYAMAKQDVRYYLNGLLLQCGNEAVRLTGCDGHRLGTIELTEAEYQQTADACESIIPRTSVELLRKQIIADSDDPITVAVTDRSIQVDFGDTQILTNLLDGRFPDYQRVIPQNCPMVVIADRLLLRNAISRASLVLNEKTSGVRLSLSEWQLEIQTRNNDQEEAEEEIEVNYTGKPLEIGFNASYLLNALDALSGSMVKLSFLDATSSVLIENAEGGTAKHVVMCMRL